MNDNTVERVRRIIAECEAGRPLTDEERSLLTHLVNRFDVIPGLYPNDLSIIRRARACIENPTDAET